MRVWLSSVAWDEAPDSVINELLGTTCSSLLIVC